MELLSQFSTYDFLRLIIVYVRSAFVHTCTRKLHIAWVYLQFVESVW